MEKIRNTSELELLAEHRIMNGYKEYWEESKAHYKREELKEIFKVSDRFIKKARMGKMNNELIELVKEKEEIIKRMKSGDSLVGEKDISLVQEKIFKKRKSMALYDTNTERNDLSIGEIKKYPIMELLPVGTQKIKTNDGYMIKCPFPEHSDNTASLSINTNKNLFKCFGCGAGGSNVDSIMNLEGIDAKKAIKYIAKII